MKIPKFDSLSDRYLKLSKSDRRAVIILAAFLFATLIYFIADWSFSYRKNSISALDRNRVLMSLLTESKQKFANKKGQAKIENLDQPLLTLVSSTAKENSIVFKRFQPEGENVLKLWMENVDFNSLLSWLYSIDKKNGISVQEISVDQSKDDGFVDVRLTLKR